MTNPVKIDPQWKLSKLRSELKQVRAYLSRAEDRRYGETDNGIERATAYRVSLERAIAAREATP